MTGHRSAPASILSVAQAITAEADRHAVVGLATTFELSTDGSPVRSAVLHATAHGVYEVAVNGTPVSTSVLDPGWTAYEWRLQVQQHDVTHLLTTRNRVEVRLAGGWYRGDLGFAGADASYGEQRAFLACLVVEYQDGTAQLVPTSTTWTGATTDSPEANLYDGQTIDARLRTRPARVLDVVEVEIDRTTLVPTVGVPVERQEDVLPVAVTTSPSGAVVVDFGVNLVGWVRCTVSGPAGTTVRLRHAEVLEDGEVCTRPLRGAAATDTFVLSGDQDELEPTQTFHGFRYVEVDGWPSDLDLATARASLTAVVVHSRMERTGWFECSDPLLDRLVENSVRSQRGNFLAVPTDCPQRDERLGWTGDIAVYAATAAFQLDCEQLLHGWLLDLAAEVEGHEHGWVPHVVPDLLKLSPVTAHLESMTGGEPGPTAIWGDAAVWVPQALWMAYGDVDLLRQHYPAMVAHLDGVERRLSPQVLWDHGFQFGDWLDPDASPHRPWAAKADPQVVAQACLYRSASFTAEAATVLGLEDDASRWRALAEAVRHAFVDHYVDDEATVRSDCVTVYALAIAFGVLDGVLADRAGERLAALVRAAGHTITTGFAGTPYVTWALSVTGHVEDAYRLLLQTRCPSWLYPVTMGATTIWERWDSMLPDGAINPGEMTSFNHYALGGVADWIYQVVGGIRPAAPGYARLHLEPVPGPGLDWARARLRTRHGLVECGWRRVDGAIEVDVLVPEGVEADVVLPDGTNATVGAGRHRLLSEAAGE